MATLARVPCPGRCDVSQDKPRRPMSTDQKRALVILTIIAILIAVVAIGTASLATAIGLPFWAAIVLAIVLSAAVGLFMFFNLA